MRKYRITLLLAALLLAWLAAGPQIIERISQQLAYTDGLPEAVALAGRLYYTQGFDGIWQVDLRTGTASQWWQPPDGGLVTGIAASPDGQRLAIAFAPPADEGFQLGTTDMYLSSVEQAVLVPLLIRETRQESFRNPAWSPDGEWLYYSHLKPLLNDSGQSAGVRLNVERVRLQDSTRPEMVLEGAEQANLSPDGMRIVYLKFDPSTYSQSLATANVDGSQPFELIPAGEFQAIASPRFSPDGQNVVFSASGELPAGSASAGVVRAHGLPWNLWRATPNHDLVSRLTPTTLDGPWFDWSPDGLHMAVLAAEGVFVVHEGRFYRLTQVTSEGEIAWAGAQ